MSNIGDSLLEAPYQLNMWFGLFLWITGNVGCIGNMIVFRFRKFRNRAYSIYLFSAAISDFHYFNFVLLTRILRQSFQVLLMNHYTARCKLRQFSTIWGNVVSSSLFSFGTIDRLLSAQRLNKYRRWTNRVSLAYKMAIIIPLFLFIPIGHRIILYRIQNGICGPPEGFYSYYDNYFQVIFSSLSPSVVMTIFAYKSVRDVVRQRIVPINNTSSIVIPNGSMINQIDAQLTVMLIPESLIAIVTFVPYAMQLTYSNITHDLYKSSLLIAWKNVFTELIHLFSYVFFAMNFYVSTFSNIGFRRKMKVLLGVKKDTKLEHRIAAFIRTAAVIINCQTKL